MQENKEMKELKVLKEMSFDRVEAITKIKESFKNLEEVTEQIKKLSDDNAIYTTIDDTREREKRIKNHFYFLHNTRFKYSWQSSDEDLLNEIEGEFKRRFRTALQCINFVSLNEKTQVIKVKKPYSFSGIELYYLNRVGEFQTNLNETGKDSDSIEILKEYQNSNVEFKFKSIIDYEMFKAMVFYSTETTQYICNNAPDEIIKKYKEEYKLKHHNECAGVYCWIRETKKFSHSEIVAINYHLINKAWGLI